MGDGGGFHVPFGFLSVNIDASRRRVQATTNEWLAREGSQMLAEATDMLVAGGERFGAFTDVQLQGYIPE